MNQGLCQNAPIKVDSDTVLRQQRLKEEDLIFGTTANALESD